ncbi:MAG: glycosyltransferase family 2 protein [Limisphaerales bacterium]
MNTPLVTICIPTYNRPDYLRRTIASCLAQTCTDFEIVITDNSTNDESARMVANIGDPRIRYYSNNGNIGSLASHLRVVSLARGKYVQLGQDDDLIKPTFLELMVEAFEKNPTVGVVMAPMALIDENDRRIYPKFYLFRTKMYRYRYQVGDGLVERKRVLRDFLTGPEYPCCVPSGMMYRAEALMKTLPFDDRAGFAGDLDTCMKIAPDWDYYYIDQVLSAWRFMPSNHTMSQSKRGWKIEAWYFITRRCLNNKIVREMFRDEWDKLERDSLFFCTCRAMLLNGLAAWRARSPKLLMQTIKIVRKEDPHWINLLRLPFFVIREIFVSIFPPKQPPARE